MDYEDIIIRGNRRMTVEDLTLMESSCRGINSKNIVEIGSMDGTSTLLLGTIAKETGGKLTCIEPNPKARWKENVKDYQLEQTVTLIMASSPWVDMSNIGQIDYLLIDGEHRTRWAIVDYHFFEPYIRKGGRIAFHDYNGMKGVKEWVRRAIDIILEDAPLKEVGHNDTKDRGLIVFEKI
jgi:predicted O-methyltransferase YrrM